MNRRNSENKQLWKAHCEKHYVPLHFRPGWMDCVCGKENWDVGLSLDGGGRVEGALIFCWKKRYGMRIIASPPLTAYTGLWLNPPAKLTKPSSRMAFEKRVGENVLKQLPSHSFFFQQWHPDIGNWLPYYWKGFRQTTLYTYRIRLLNSPIELMSGMSKSARKRSRKAAGEFIATCSEDPKLVYDLYRLSLGKQGIVPKFSIEMLMQLDEFLSENNQRKILVASDSNNRVVAAQYLVWDERATYALFGGIHPEHRNSGALSMLFSIALSNNYGKSELFDFEGSVLESVEESLRSFGGKLTPHFQITRAANRWLDMLFHLRTW